MPAPENNTNALGNSGGKIYNDRILAAEIRQLTLKQIKKILKGDDTDYKRQLLLRLAGNVLPRLRDEDVTPERPLTIVFDPAFKQLQEQQ